MSAQTGQLLILLDTPGPVIAKNAVVEAYQLASLTIFARYHLLPLLDIQSRHLPVCLLLICMGGIGGQQRLQVEIVSGASY